MPYTILDHYPGGVGIIRGSLLKFDEADPRQGVFFVAGDGTESRASKIVKNKPGEIILMIPEGLQAGVYEVVVRSVFKNTKELREGFLTDDLTIR